MSNYYPTEEEEYELLYGDELELLNEIDTEPENSFVTVQKPTSQKNDKNTPVFPASPALSQISHPPGRGESSPGLNTPIQQRMSLFSSPALSQISHPSTSSGAVVNRALFPEAQKRTCSTPYVRNTTSTPAAATAVNAMNSIGLLHNGGVQPTKKRRIEDLFGDIRDIDEISEVEYEQYAKKVKNEEERDLELIEKILEARRRHQDQLNPLRDNEVDRLRNLHHYKMQNLSYTVPKWPFIPIVRNDGQRVYVRFHSEEFEQEKIQEIETGARCDGSLLGQTKEQTWNRARAIMLKLLTNATETIEEIRPVIVETPDANLWVEKYKPRRYIDLLSDESTNRTLLKWLKMWDKVVFGREPPTKSITTTINGSSSTALNTFNKKTGRFEPGGFKKKFGPILNPEFDEIGRPMQKIALLCGPPGLGKTTLAHTIARHAGYVVREMNASDDRSQDAFRLMLENCTQMKSVLNKDNRPNCIIMDEIDGAPQASIDFLVRFVQDGVNVKGKKKGVAAGQGSGKTIVKRPIICICNDMYTPALRQLKQIAFVVNFPPIESGRLAERLLAIARKEQISTDLMPLITLAEKSGNDVRSCISMLQFFAGLKKPLTLSEVLRSNIGQKDRQKSLFAIWTAVFQIVKLRQNRQALLDDENDGMDVEITRDDMLVKTRMQNVIEAVHMGGDYQRLMEGVFENYLAQKMPDGNMLGVVEALEWFCFSDRIQNLINQQQNYAVYPYLQYGFVAWHLLFAGMARPKINFPKKGFEAAQKVTTLKMILTALKRGISPAYKGVGEGGAILLDTIPYVKRVVCPSLSSLPIELLSSREKHDLTHTVRVMSDLNIGYIHLKAADGSYQYKLEPDLELITTFTGVTSPQISNWNKQLIAREVELEQIRRTTAKVNNNTDETMIKKKIDKKLKEKQSDSFGLPNHLRTLKPKSITENGVQEKVFRDLFGRIITKSVTPMNEEELQKKSDDTIVKSPIWYRYKEGFNNAVRKDVTFHELLYRK